LIGGTVCAKAFLSALPAARHPPRRPPPCGWQRYACRPCRRDVTERSASAFAGFRWPAAVILLAVRWSLRHPLSAASVMELLWYRCGGLGKGCRRVRL
jgi:hypothetical protein